MNTIGADTVQMMHAGLRALNDGFDAMVIGNQGANFCAGANLMLILMTIQEGEWDELDLAAKQFQNANMALKYAPKPVVAAPFGLTLGGGVEICLHCTEFALRPKPTWDWWRLASALFLRAAARRRCWCVPWMLSPGMKMPTRSPT